MKKQLFLLLLISFCFAAVSQAQWYAGAVAHYGYVIKKNNSFTDFNTFAYGLQLQYKSTDKPKGVSARLTVCSSVQAKIPCKFFLLPVSGAQGFEKYGHLEYQFLDAVADLKFSSPEGLYFLIGGGYHHGTRIFGIDYDPEKYNVNVGNGYPENEKIKTNSFLANAGVGYDFKFKYFNLFTEVSFAVSGQQMNPYAKSPMQGTLNVNAGISIPLGKRSTVAE